MHAKQTAGSEIPGERHFNPTTIILFAADLVQGGPVSSMVRTKEVAKRKNSLGISARSPVRTFTDLS
jgi:hypothetical protein